MPRRSPGPAARRPRRALAARSPTAWRGLVRSWLRRLHLRATSGASQEDFFERGAAGFDDLATKRKDRVVEVLGRSAVDDAPRASAALQGQRGIEDGRMIEVLVEPHAAALVRAAHVVEYATQDLAAAVQHRHVVRHPLHFFEQV